VGWAELEREGLGWYVFGFGSRLTPTFGSQNWEFKPLDRINSSEKYDNGK